MYNTYKYCYRHNMTTPKLSFLPSCPFLCQYGFFSSKAHLLLTSNYIPGVNILSRDLFGPSFQQKYSSQSNTYCFHFYAMSSDTQYLAGRHHQSFLILFPVCTLTRKSLYLWVSRWKTIHYICQQQTDHNQREY